MIAKLRMGSSESKKSSTVSEYDKDTHAIESVDQRVYSVNAFLATYDTIALLKQAAKDNLISIPTNITRKADIQNYLISQLFGLSSTSTTKLQDETPVECPLSRTKRIEAAVMTYTNPKIFDHVNMNDIVEAYIQTYKVKKWVNANMAVTALSMTDKYKNIKPIEFFAFVWTRSMDSVPDLSNGYHASTIVSCKATDGQYLFMHISHQEKGVDLVTIDVDKEATKIAGKKIYKFPFVRYMFNNKPFYEYIPSQGIYGAIVCKGPVRSGVTVKDIADVALKWWYTVDYMSGFSRSRFPASCTGLTETMISFLSSNPSSCPDIKTGTRYEAKYILNKAEPIIIVS